MKDNSQLFGIRNSYRFLGSRKTSSRILCAPLPVVLPANLASSPLFLFLLLQRQFQGLRKTVVRKVKGGEAIMIIVSRRSDHRVRKVKATRHGYPRMRRDIAISLATRRPSDGISNSAIIFIRYSLIAKKLVDDVLSSRRGRSLRGTIVVRCRG